MAYFPRLFASNATYSAVGPINGQPTKVTPSLSAVANGVVPGVPFGAEHLNSELNDTTRVVRASAHIHLSRLREVPKPPVTVIATSSTVSASVAGPVGTESVLLLNSGQHYAVAKNGTQTFDLAAGFTGPYAAAEGTIKVLLTGQGGATVQVSATGGLVWTNRHTPYTAAGASGTPIGVAFNPTNLNEFVILDFNGNLYYSTDTGASFTEFVTGFDEAVTPANSGQVCFDAAGNLYVIGLNSPSTRLVGIRQAGSGFLLAYGFPAGLATGGATITCGGRASVPLFAARTASNQPRVYTVSPAGVFTLAADLTVPFNYTATNAPRLISESQRLSDVTVLFTTTSTGGSYFWYSSEAEGDTTWHPGGFLPFGATSSTENLAYVQQRLLYVDKSLAAPNVRVFLSDGVES